MNHMPQRCWQLLLGWGSVGVLYTLASALPLPPAWPLPSTLIDQAIAFNPHWLFWYVSFFAFIPHAFFSCNTSQVLGLRRAFQCCAVVSALVFVLFPTTIAYPELPNANNAAQHAWLWLHQFDTRHNCLPSLHASLTTMAWLALQQQAKPLQRLGNSLWYALIVYSILATKRHYSMDVAAGILLGCVCYIWIQQRQHRQIQPKMVQP